MYIVTCSVIQCTRNLQTQYTHIPTLTNVLIKGQDFLLSLEYISPEIKPTYFMQKFLRLISSLCFYHQFDMQLGIFLYFHQFEGFLQSFVELLLLNIKNKTWFKSEIYIKILNILFLSYLFCFHTSSEGNKFNHSLIYLSCISFTKLSRYTHLYEYKHTQPFLFPLFSYAKYIP